MVDVASSSNTAIVAELGVGFDASLFVSGLGDFSPSLFLDGLSFTSPPATTVDAALENGYTPL